MKMNWFRSVRYDVSQVRALSVMCKRDFKRDSRMEWLIVSKAAVRSRRMRMDSRPESEERRRSLVTLRSAVSVLWWVQNLD